MSTTLDGFSRVTSKTTTNGNHTLTTTFTYAAGANGGTTSARVTGIQQLDSAHTHTYTYTDAGLIASVTIGTDTVAYTYDSIGQLIQVDDPTDKTAGSTGGTPTTSAETSWRKRLMSTAQPRRRRARAGCSTTATARGRTS